jgi:hypothetical protein
MVHKLLTTICIFLETTHHGFNNPLELVSTGPFSPPSAGRSDRAKIAWDQAETDLDRRSQEIRLDYEAAVNQYQLAIDNHYNEQAKPGISRTH